MTAHAFDGLLLRDFVDLIEVQLATVHGRDLGLEAGLPIALLPVRLEARFTAPADDPARTLQVRIIPDDIHVPTLETGITPREAALANAYREAAADAKDAAWDALVAACGSTTARVLRAAWLASSADRGAVTPQARSTLTARGLPEKWFVVAYGEDRVVASDDSEDVRAELVIDPAADADETLWLTDFPAAVTAGMAVELAVGTASVDVLLAVGVRSGADGSASAAELAALFEAQRFSRDVDFLAPGTPTNNTPAERTTWRSAPDVAEIRRRVGEAPVGSAPGTDGRALTSALGLPADTAALSRPRAAARVSQSDAAAMLDVLWPVTGGELLDTMLSDMARFQGVPKDVSEEIRHHASRFVRGRGPLPTILVGRQPYGVLPALSLAKWVPEGGALAGLHRRLLTGWALWEDSVRRTPRLGGAGAGDNSTKLIAELMCQSPVPDPAGYKATTILPPAYSLTRPFAPFAGVVDGDIAMGMLQVSWPPLLTATGEDTKKVGSVVLPAVDPEGGASLRSLRTGGEHLLLKILLPDAARPDLLSQLAQRALIRAAERAATYVSDLLATAFNAPALALEVRSALVNDLGSMSLVSPLNFTMRHFKPDAEVSIADKTLGNLLDEPDLYKRVFTDFEVHRQPRSPEYDAAVGAVEHLSNLDAPTLELLLGETLDIFSNRYDAWVTSLATRRLHDLRAARAEGVHLGAYGWLVDLEPERIGPAGADVVHAPSPAQAATAAVLRHADIDDRAVSIDGSDTARRFDLTSTSVRIARGILEAVSQGQPLSAVLGYRIERFLQDAPLISAIPALREAYGTFGGEPPEGTTHPAETIPAHDVVDGVAVWRALDRGEEVQGLTPDARNKLVEHVFEIMDALSDLVVAEGVHQIVGGDRTRAGATITALSRGVPPPAQLRVVDSPGRHLAVPTQLLMAAGADAVAAGGGWAKRPRAEVAAAAEKLARAVLPDPSQCGFVVEIEDPAGSGVIRTERVALNDLGLCALDVLAEVGSDDAHSPLASRIRFALGDGAAGGRLIASAPDGLPVGWGALTALARTWARVFGSARPFLPSDIAIGPDRGEDAPAPPDPAALEAALKAATEAAASHVGRVVDAAQELQGELDRLGTGAPDDAFVGRVASPLEIFRAAGLAGTAQEPGAEPSAILALVRRCAGAGVTVGQSWQRVSATPDKDHPSVAERPGAGDVSERTERLAAAVREIFGEVVVVAPGVDAVGLTVRDKDIADRLPASDEVSDWLGELSEVRISTRRWWQAVLATEALTGKAPTLLPTQLPGGSDDWIGGFALPKKGWKPPFGARRAFVAHVPAPIEGTAVSALVVESWLEQVPIGFESDPHGPTKPAGEAPPAKVAGHLEPTGVATHYNAAGARPPQSILLAVAPDPAAATWRLGDLVATLLETLELSRFRAIEPPADLPHRAVLPAIFVPEGIEGLSFVSLLLQRLADIDVSLITNHTRRFGDG